MAANNQNSSNKNNSKSGNNGSTEKRGPGRPPGSKNKSSSQKSTQKSSASKSTKTATSPEQQKLDRIMELQEKFDRDKRNLDVIWSITLIAFSIFLFFLSIYSSD